MYKKDLALNNLECLICYKTKLTNKPTNPTRLFASIGVLFIDQIHVCK